MGSEMLRCAQHDSAVTHTDAWINLLLSISGPLRTRHFFARLTREIRQQHRIHMLQWTRLIIAVHQMKKGCNDVSAE